MSDNAALGAWTMGILDVIKRWFGGGKSASTKPDPTKPTPQARSFSPTPSPPPTPVPTQPAAPLTANEALDVIAANRAVKAAAALDRREKPRVNARDGTRVLIIDDSPTIVALLKRMLEQNGYKAVEAMDAETGLAIAKSEAPDLIFLDIVLPGMNGFEALRRLRRDSVTKVTPIVMISGNELATEQFYAQRIGADDFMKKPFSRSEVFARIEKLLDADKVPRRHLAVAAPVVALDGSTPPGSLIPAIATPIDVGPAKSVTAETSAQPAAPAAADVAVPAVAAPEPATPVSADPMASAPSANPAGAPEEATPAAAAVPTVLEVETPAVAAVAPAIEATTPAAVTPSNIDVPTSSAEPIVAEPVPEVAASAAPASASAAAAMEEAPPAPVANEIAEPTASVEPDVSVATATGDVHAVATPATAEPIEAAAERTPPKAPDRAETISIEESFQAQTAAIVDSIPTPVVAAANIVAPLASQVVEEPPMLVSGPFAEAHTATPMTLSAIASPVHATGHQVTSG